MCPICGVLNQDDKDVSAQVHSIMSTLHRKGSEAWLVTSGVVRRWDVNRELLAAGQVLG